jgi:hypothetical protein
MKRVVMVATAAAAAAAGYFTIYYYIRVLVYTNLKIASMTSFYDFGFYDWLL